MQSSLVNEDDVNKDNDDILVVAVMDGGGGGWSRRGKMSRRICQEKD